VSGSPNVLTVVPCRTASERLPGKGVIPIHGIAAVERCLLNTRAIESSTLSVLATSTDPSDDVLEDHTLGGAVDLVRGSEEDVLERFLVAIDRHRPDLVIRATGDCPVVSYELADLLVEAHLDSGADVTVPGPGFPPGINSEVYTASALRRLRELAPATLHSEYLIFYFRNNPRHFRVHELELPDRFRRDWRLTLDEPSDLELFELLFGTLDVGREPLSWNAIVDFFAEHPEATAINAENRLRYVHDAAFTERLRAATTL